MFLTLYYMYATFVQLRRLSALRNKIRGTLNSKNALLVCEETVMLDTKKSRIIENLLFKRSNKIGITVVPKQSVNLGSQWLGFPKDFAYFPIYCQPVTIANPTVYVLMHAVLDTYKKHQATILNIEEYGELVAWKITDNLEIILRTNMDKLAVLVHCFAQAECDINHELKLLKIETVDVDGFAKKIQYEKQYSVQTRQNYSLHPIHWQDFVADFKQLYSKIRDATNPKITIDNGTPKPEDVKVVPVSEVKPIKKDKNKSSEEKNTLDVNCSDYRRHRTSEHGNKDHRPREHRKHRSREDAARHRSEREEEASGEQSVPNREEAQSAEPTAETSTASSDKKSNANRHKEHRRRRKEDDDHSRNNSHRSADAVRKTTTARTSSKEKKLVRASATCDEPNEDKAERRQEGRHQEIVQATVAPQANGNGSNSQGDGPVTGSANNSDRNGIDKKTLLGMKPPNVLVYADSAVTRENVKEALQTILNREKYIIYDMPPYGVDIWKDSTALVVVCGNVDQKQTFDLLKFLTDGGQLLCLCSDLLYSVLHTFTTAEVREHELVRFNYGKWRNVKMMHHIFCYQASPARKQFSKDSDTSTHSSGNGSSPIAPKTPSTVDIQHDDKSYTVQVQVLGAEETWQTPSLLLATVTSSKGRAVFSQVHLEIDPIEYAEDESKYAALKDSDQARLDILKDLLSHHLGLDCSNATLPELTPAYFLGRHDLKVALLNETHSIKDFEMKSGEVHVLFCGKNERYDDPTDTFLPVLIYACPQNFNTVSYFETLATKEIGRLVIYSDVFLSTQTLLRYTQLTHGVAVIGRQQLNGVGRSKNSWLSPSGSAPFSLQLHISNITNLGRAPSLVQHLIMVAVVKAIKRLTGNHEGINLGIKWPNDLYANGTIKIGGAMVSSTILGGLSSVNVGCGLNLSNSNPTICINDMIRETNRKYGTKIPEISHEKYFAQVFNETEKLLSRVQIGDLDYLFDYYYDYWLHNDAIVTVTTKDGKSAKVQVVGIDDHGYLRVRAANGEIDSVQPDGNSFDMMKGLIYPKVY